ncbi:MarR family winged helix-turn-helix transcriptional regulator [Aquincola tertiaricarbonis]|uniref:MarR family winged helix-turn-helix transcriptional regulator n=1 Tax=Aquincola tertiaricarbonis TaxID=391953 RepID=A0ABY4SB42_AQUTE|nr:MarR family winged helix-turn-helix transcriptional regulator [Aquincola tertiaricarbonis]URI08256.1 MarR family winged helix-turn-helix transcriptional regulator [Aquincola tertiaricarbonis]
MSANSRSNNRFNPGSPDFHKEEYPFYWIARVHARYSLDMERALKPVGRDIPTWRVLAILSEQGTSSVSDIAMHAVAKLSTITKIVYRMKAEGLVTTATAEHDGRVTVVSLTEAGERAMQRVNDATHSLWLKSFAGLTPAKVAKLNELLKALLANLER